MGDSEELSEKVKQKIDDYKHVFGTKAGQRVLRDLEEFCGFQADGFNPDPYVTAYNCGRRSVGAFILQWMELSRTEFQDMVRQQIAENE